MVGVGPSLASEGNNGMADNLLATKPILQGVFISDTFEREVPTSSRGEGFDEEVLATALDEIIITWMVGQQGDWFFEVNGYSVHKFLLMHFSCLSNIVLTSWCRGSSQT